MTQRPPSVRTWFPDEIENQINAVDQANGAIAGAIDTPEMALYRRGFRDAMDALRASFGLPCSSSGDATPRIRRL